MPHPGQDRRSTHPSPTAAALSWPGVRPGGLPCGFPAAFEAAADLPGCAALMVLANEVHHLVTLTEATLGRLAWTCECGWHTTGASTVSSVAKLEHRGQVVWAELIAFGLASVAGAQVLLRLLPETPSSVTLRQLHQVAEAVAARA